MDLENTTIPSSNKGLDDHSSLTRSPLKDFTNTPTRFEESGGVLNKNNAAGSGNEEDLKQDLKLHLEPADKLSQGSLPSTPTTSVVDTDTTTDYESADDDQTAVDFSLIANNLEQIHISSPSKSIEENREDHQLRFPYSPCEKTVYFSSPEGSEYNCTFATVIDKTLYKSTISNYSDGGSSDEPISDKTELKNDKSDKKGSLQNFSASFGYDEQSSIDKVSEVTHDFISTVGESLNNINISPIEIVQPSRTNYLNVDEKYLSPLSDLDKSFIGDEISTLISDSPLSRNQLNEVSLNEVSKDISVKSIDEERNSFEEVPLDENKETIIVNLTADNYFLNVGNVSSNEDDIVETADEAQETNSNLNLEKVDIELDSNNVIIEKNISTDLIEKSKSEELSLLDNKPPNEVEIIQPQSSISINQPFDLAVSENIINKNTSVSDDLQGIKDIQSDFDSLIYNDVVNEVVIKDNNKKSEDNTEEGKLCNNLIQSNDSLITSSNSDNNQLNKSSTCLSFNVDQTSLTNHNSNNNICQEKLVLDQNSELFDTKQQIEFISSDCKAVGTPVTSDLETYNNSCSDLNKSDRSISLNIDQSSSSTLINNQPEDNEILVEDLQNQELNSTELKIEFSPLNVSSASDRELQVNIETCKALLLEEISDSADKRLSERESLSKSVSDQRNTSSNLSKDFCKLNLSGSSETQIFNKTILETENLDRINSLDDKTNTNSITVLDHSEKFIEKDKELPVPNYFESLVDLSDCKNVEKVVNEDIKVENTSLESNKDNVLTEREIENHKQVKLGNEESLKSNIEKSLEKEINYKEDVSIINRSLETLPEPGKHEDSTAENIKDIVLSSNTDISDISIATINKHPLNYSICGITDISCVSTEEILPVKVENLNVEAQNFNCIQSCEKVTDINQTLPLCDSISKVPEISQFKPVEVNELCDDVHKLNISEKLLDKEVEVDTTADKDLTEYFTKHNELSGSLEQLTSTDERNLSAPLNLSTKKHNKIEVDHFNISLECEKIVEAIEKTQEDIQKEPTIKSSVTFEDNVTRRDLTSTSLHEATSLNSSFSKELLQTPLNRSHKDLSDLIATCSKQERELAEKEVIETNRKARVSFKKEETEITKGLIMAEDSDDQEVNQHMMQPPPSADINNSEAGPITADEDFNKGEFFQEATAIDFSLTPARLAPSLTRKSLYIKFDPLIEGALESAASEKVSQDNFVRSAAAEMADTKIGESGDVEKTPKKDRSLKDSQTLIMINTPGSKATSDLAGTEKLNNSSSPSTPNNSTTKRTLGSGGTPSLRQEVSKLQDLMLEQEQAYVEQLAEKNDMIGSLKTRVLELEAKEPRGDLEDKLKAKEIEVAKMRKELNENILTNKQLLTVMEEYEKAIASSVRRREDERNEFEKIKEKIAGERDTALHHLNNMEVAFNDIHLKYERCKSLIETLHNNEKQLQQTIAEQDKMIEQQKQSYAKLKQHATEKVNEANQDIAATHKTYQAEIAKMKAMSKKAELKVKSLEESLEQKKKEIKELAKICDELIGKVEQ